MKPRGRVFRIWNASIGCDPPGRSVIRPVRSGNLFRRTVGARTLNSTRTSPNVADNWQASSRLHETRRPDPTRLDGAEPTAVSSLRQAANVAGQSPRNVIRIRATRRSTSPPLCSELRPGRVGAAARLRWPGGE